MPEFFRHANWHYSTADVTAYAERDDGSVTVEFTRRTPVVLEGDDAAAFLAWVKGHVVEQARSPGAPLVTKTAKHSKE